MCFHLWSLRCQSSSSHCWSLSSTWAFNEQTVLSSSSLPSSWFWLRFGYSHCSLWRTQSSLSTSSQFSVLLLQTHHIWQEHETVVLLFVSWGHQLLAWSCLWSSLTASSTSPIRDGEGQEYSVQLVSFVFLDSFRLIVVGGRVYLASFPLLVHSSVSDTVW